MPRYIKRCKQSTQSSENHYTLLVYLENSHIPNYKNEHNASLFSSLSAAAATAETDCKSTHFFQHGKIFVSHALPCRVSCGGGIPSFYACLSLAVSRLSSPRG